MEESLATEFAENGYTVIPGFYDVEAEIRPIQEAIREIIALVAEKYGVEADCTTPRAAMTSGYMAIAQANRSWGGEIYDAVKQIPAFMQLVSSPRNADLFASLRADSLPGLAAGGYGIRIDLPMEEKFRAFWHQEFPAQLRSLDGIVFWSPLVPITEDLGPVELCPGSHKEGCVPVFEDEGGVGRSGAYALRLANEEGRIAKHPKIAPLSKPGDLILMDFLTLHQSGRNRAAHPRWSMQFRWFNFREATGIRIGWKGSFAAGEKFSEILPELTA